jgi:hypothetical protein
MIMIVVSDIRPELHRRAQELVPERYESLDELLNVALENQLVLEQDRSASQSRPSLSPTSNGDDSLKRTQRDEIWDWVRSVKPGGLQSVRPPDAERWALPVLWGQVNRLLPIIAGIRVLGNMLHEQDSDRISLAEWQDQATRAATVLHAYLMALDQESDRKRGDLWATGFPRDDRGSGRRYANQFLGRGSFKAPGAAEQLGFIAIGKQDEIATVGITEAGIELSQLANPILDRGEASETISLQEAQCYLNLLDRQLPDERRFMATVAELINETGSRAALETAIEDRHPQWRKYAGTLRAGAIGRLHDLGCLARTREGTTVTYGLSPRAKEIHLID